MIKFCCDSYLIFVMLFFVYLFCSFDSYRFLLFCKRRHHESSFHQRIAKQRNSCQEFVEIHSINRIWLWKIGGMTGVKQRRIGLCETTGTAQSMITNTFTILPSYTLSDLRIEICFNWWEKENISWWYGRIGIHSVDEWKRTATKCARVKISKWLNFCKFLYNILAEINNV